MSRKWYLYDMKKTEVEIILPVSIFKEGRAYVAYTPSLDLSTSGRTYPEAERHFGEAVTLFFEELLRKGNLEEVLSNLGWRKIRRAWQPPIVVSHKMERMRVPA